MAFKTFKTKRDVVTLEILAASIARRRAVVGEVAVPRNPGTNRTPAKRALLAEIEKLGGKW